MNAEFRVSEDGIWRWVSKDPAHSKVEVKFELLADLENRPAGETFSFDNCKNLGAVNLRGTRFAAEDFTQMRLRAKIGGVYREASGAYWDSERSGFKSNPITDWTYEQ